MEEEGAGRAGMGAGKGREEGKQEGKEAQSFLYHQHFIEFT